MAFPRSFLAALFVFSFSGSVALSCPFCFAERGPTLADDFNLATVVLLGRVDKNDVDANNEFRTYLTVDKVIKPHASFGAKKNVVLRGHLTKNATYLVYCDVFKGKLDGYRSVEVPAKSELVKYLQGAIAIKDRPVGERLRFSFEHLTSTEQDISLDAYREFALADYKDYAAIAKDLPADKIAGWLRDPKTPAFRYGLYASLLGHCGKAEHAKQLKGMVEKCLQEKSSDIDGLMAGYLMLQPKEAWTYLQNILREQKDDFGVRYACIRVARFLREQRPDLVDAKELTAGVAIALDYPDMADHAIDFLRHAKSWDRTKQVLELWGKKSPGKDFDNDYVKRAIVRYVLSCPEPTAVEFLKNLRGRNPAFVSHTEELLKLDVRDGRR